MSITEIQAEIAAIKAAFAGMRASIEKATRRSPKLVSGRTHHVIRLGEAFLVQKNAESFTAALGFSRVRTFGRLGFRHPEYRPMCDAQRKASRVNTDWVRIKRRPPKRLKETTYQFFIEFFDHHWPADLEWPADIPRPTPKKEAA